MIFLRAAATDVAWPCEGLVSAITAFPINAK